MADTAARTEVKVRGEDSVVSDFTEAGRLDVRHKSSYKLRCRHRHDFLSVPKYGAPHRVQSFSVPIVSAGLIIPFVAMFVR